uniref:Serine/threonine-protein kinase TOUSLED-like n=1 Tax=Nicotiana tabacum TaxID=4097 RepID=A0A1S4BL79_TOBAC
FCSGIITNIPGYDQEELITLYELHKLLIANLLVSSAANRSPSSALKARFSFSLLTFPLPLNQNGREFLIQANTQKRRKLEDDNSSTSFEHVETAADTVKKIVDNTDTSNVGSDVSRRKQSRVKGQTNSGRGRGSRISDQTKPQAVSVSNGQLENSYQKLQDGLPKEQIGHDRQTVFEEEITSLRAKVVALEEELKKSRQEASDYQHQCQQLEKELKDLKDYEQQIKPKVCFISCFTSFGWLSSVSALETISI